MKNFIKVICFASVCAVSTVFTRDLPEGTQERLEEIEKECYNVVDEIFLNARHAVIDKEDLLNPEWFKKQPINGIRHGFSDALIISFDYNEPYTMAEKVEAYVQKKASQDVLCVLSEGTDIDGLKNFLWVARILCELSYGSDCRSMVRDIKNSHRPVIEVLKAEKEARLKEAHLARENLLLGAAAGD